MAGEMAAESPLTPATLQTFVPAADLESLHAGLGTTAQADADDEADATDAIDPDLFPIFEEEAQELLPRLGTALRQWAAHPSDLEARNAALRVLHTFKGSARLAGAMRLGARAHRLESLIEQLDAHHSASNRALARPLRCAERAFRCFVRAGRAGSECAAGC